jgi:hypothetical protein
MLQKSVSELEVEVKSQQTDKSLESEQLMKRVIQLNEASTFTL